MGKQRGQEALTKIKNSNVRMTPQRVAVLEALLNSKSHPTADQIYQQVGKRFPTISPATVYNNLHTLCESGLAQELTFGNHSSRYDGDPSEHYHVICTDCGSIVDLHYPLLKEMEALAEQTTGFHISHHCLEIYGVCAECEAERGKA
ncbi:Fur family transcriptional regulator [Virgibacillus xinjiangensis]|uniref:Fur family transcriptional regulator n=1 Tax=Virgibacillus xinjiangensis TaxID=393090 RepID=A0ABV7CWU6_9BACI